MPRADRSGAYRPDLSARILDAGGSRASSDGRAARVGARKRNSERVTLLLREFWGGDTMSDLSEEEDLGYRGRAETPEDSVEGDSARKKRKDKKRRKRTPAEKEARRMRKEKPRHGTGARGARPAGASRATTAP